MLNHSFAIYYYYYFVINVKQTQIATLYFSLILFILY